MKCISHSEKDTGKLASKIAKSLKGGEVIGLIGELGAGKTTFTKALAKALGIDKKITSPTFVLMKIYPVDLKGSAVENLVHIDAYRISDTADFSPIGAEEYMNRPDTVVIIEWADKIIKKLPPETRFITFKTSGEDRSIEY